MNWLQKYREDYSATIKIGVPIVLGQLGIVVVGLVDNIMVGHFSTSDLAAASFVNSVFNIPILFGTVSYTHLYHHSPVIFLCCKIEFFLRRTLFPDSSEHVEFPV